MSKITTKFNLGDKIKLKETANFYEKSDKNKLVYNTYKNRVGVVREIRPTNSKSITYIIEMNGKNDNIFTFDILEKYVEKYDDIEFQINENVRIKSDANFIEKNIQNREKYMTYKNKEGKIIEKKNSTYIVDFSDDKIDILGKYLEKII